MSIPGAGNEPAGDSLNGDQKNWAIGVIPSSPAENQQEDAIVFGEGAIGIDSRVQRPSQRSPHGPCSQDLAGAASFGSGCNCPAGDEL